MVVASRGKRHLPAADTLLDENVGFDWVGVEPQPERCHRELE